MDMSLSKLWASSNGSVFLFVSSFLIYLFIYFTLQYCIGFAIHWLDSVVLCFYINEEHIISPKTVSLPQSCLFSDKRHPHHKSHPDRKCRYNFDPCVSFLHLKKKKFFFFNCWIVEVLYSFIYLCVWPYRTACGILVPQPAVKSTSPALETWTQNHWTAREIPFVPYS